MSKQSDKMEEIEARLDAQDKLLHEILWCLKGNPTMNVEGVMPAQKRIEEKIDREIRSLDRDIKSLYNWQGSIQKYFDVVNSKGFKLFVLFGFLSFAAMFVYLKFGWLALVNFFKHLI